MIRGFQPKELLEPESPGQIQWGAAVGAGLITGAILLVVPRGSPWAGITFFSPVIMGRNAGAVFRIALVFAWLAHLGISLIYGLIISAGVAHLVRGRAILTGGAIGLGLYGVNLLVVWLIWPGLVGNEVSVAFTHVVFGLIAAGAYRGLLKRKTVGIASGQETKHA